MAAFYSNIKDPNELRRIRAELVTSQASSSHGGGDIQARINAVDAQLKAVSAAPKPAAAAPKPAAAPPAPVAAPAPNTFAQQAAAAIAAPPPVPTAVVPPAVETITPPPIAGQPAPPPPPVGGLATVEAAPTAPQLGDAQARVEAAKPDATVSTTATNAIAEALKKRKVGFAATQFTGEAGVQGLLGRVGQKKQLLG